jgi:hypothetical protein
MSPLPGRGSLAQEGRDDEDCDQGANPLPDSLFRQRMLRRGDYHHNQAPRPQFERGGGDRHRRDRYGGGRIVCPSLRKALSAPTIAVNGSPKTSGMTNALSRRTHPLTPRPTTPALAQTRLPARGGSGFSTTKSVRLAPSTHFGLSAAISYPSRGDGQAILAALFANAYQRSTHNEDASAEKATYRRSGRATRRQRYAAVQRYALQDRQRRTEEHGSK